MSAEGGPDFTFRFPGGWLAPFSRQLRQWLPEMSGLWNFSCRDWYWSEKFESNPILISKIFEYHQSHPILIHPCKSNFFYFASWAYGFCHVTRNTKLILNLDPKRKPETFWKVLWPYGHRLLGLPRSHVEQRWALDRTWIGLDLDYCKFCWTCIGSGLSRWKINAGFLL